MGGTKRPASPTFLPPTFLPSFFLPSFFLPIPFFLPTSAFAPITSVVSTGKGAR